MPEFKEQTRFGEIHFLHRVGRFQNAILARLLISILIFAFAGITTGWFLLEAGAPAQHNVTAIQLLAPSHAPPKSTAKQARLAIAAPLADRSRVEMIEARMDGSLAEYAYIQTNVDLDQQDDQRPARSMESLVKPTASSRAEDVFATVLRGAKPDQDNRPTSAPLAYADGAAGHVRGVPINVSTSEKQDADPIKHIVVMPAADQSLSDVLAGLESSPAKCLELVRLLKAAILRTGDRLDALLTDQAGSRQLLMVRLKKNTGEDLIIGRVEDDSFKEIRQPIVFDRLMREATSSARDLEEPLSSDNAPDLTQAQSDFPQLVHKLLHAHVPPDVVLQIVDLARKNKIQIDTDADVKGKVHLMFREGNGRKELVSVSFATESGERQFYRYHAQPESPAEFFDIEGHSVSKFLLKNPVPAGRLGDGFAWRIHPILGVRKHHDGVDYTAPLGSPIVAAGDGTIELISWQPGYGRYIRVRHEQGYFTTYAHIDHAAKGVAVGQRVSQGQVIAYVGSTGLSTGPHLYYELRKARQYLDPTTANFPAGTVLTGKALSDFRNEVNRLNGIDKLIDTSTDGSSLPKRG
ncbi:M23 family metallopeptidase [Oryzifoliimicrobium ureilyticus]|uniref:M23 family metallopeptidase n=1 Tax=Oryzifoliimicrobium ureilyticus TaxID=3113724 RepID=UPI00307606DF